jgi:hypothetical protein
MTNVKVRRILAGVFAIHRCELFAAHDSVHGQSLGCGPARRSHSSSCSGMVASWIVLIYTAVFWTFRDKLGTLQMG